MSAQWYISDAIVRQFRKPFFVVKVAEGAYLRNSTRERVAYGSD